MIAKFISFPRKLTVAAALIVTTVVLCIYVTNHNELHSNLKAASNIPTKVSPLKSEVKKIEASEFFSLEEISGRIKLKASSTDLKSVPDDELAAILLHSGSKACYDELARRRPLTSKLSLALFLKSPSANDRLVWAKAMCDIEPSNGLNWMLLASVCSEKGDAVATLDFLGRASNGVKFASSVDEVNLELKALAAKMGTSTRDDADFFAAGVEVESAMLKQINKVTSTLKPMFGINPESMDGESSSKFSAALGAVRRLEKMPGSSLIATLTGWSIERALISGIPEDFEYGETGQTVGQRIEWIQSQQQTLKSLGDETNLILSKASDALISTYTDRVKIEGQIPAMGWLLKTTGHSP